MAMQHLARAFSRVCQRRNTQRSSAPPHVKVRSGAANTASVRWRERLYCCSRGSCGVCCCAFVRVLSSVCGSATLQSRASGECSSTLNPQPAAPPCGIYNIQIRRYPFGRTCSNISFFDPSAAVVQALRRRRALLEARRWLSPLSDLSGWASSGRPRARLSRGCSCACRARGGRSCVAARKRRRGL